MEISVVVCTYNRCGSLGKALESIASSILPVGVEWEVLVVDNNSKDRTREIVESFCVRFPGRFRYLFEQRQGKSFALNSGVHHAVGKTIAFTDDDVVVEPTWLDHLTAPLRSGSCTGTAGRICAPSDVTLPLWISLEGRCSLAGVLALFDRGPLSIELSDPPYGANMAFQRELFDELGLFRTDLGPNPGNAIRGEDTEFSLRVMDSGKPIQYVPTAIVYHEVPENRLRKGYFLSWYFDYGRSVIRRRERRPDIWIFPRPIVGVFNRLLVLFPEAVVQWLRT